jgi:hypothetical protein
MSLDRDQVLKYAWRGALIAVMSAGILLLTHQYLTATHGNSRAALWGPDRLTAPPVIEPLDGSTLLGSHECVLNGEKVQFSQYRSVLPPPKVVEQFERQFGQPTEESPPNRGTMVRIVAYPYASAGAVDSEGRTIAIVAHQEPSRGGSTYVVCRNSGGMRKEWRQGDAPGEELPGIPRPLRSRRIFCIDGLGGIPSRLLVYEGWGAIDDTLELFATEMPKAGWQRKTEAESIIQKQLPGRFLSFLNGKKRAMIYVERDEGTNKVRTAVAYSVKAWLPPDRGI